MFVIFCQGLGKRRWNVSLILYAPFCRWFGKTNRNKQQWNTSKNSTMNIGWNSCSLKHVVLTEQTNMEPTRASKCGSWWTSNLLGLNLLQPGTSMSVIQVQSGLMEFKRQGNPNQDLQKDVCSMMGTNMEPNGNRNRNWLGQGPKRTKPAVPFLDQIQNYLLSWLEDFLGSCRVRAMKCEYTGG